MSQNSISEKYTVVAAPGHNVMLTINGQSWVIDCYHPVRLGAYFDDETLDRCEGLRTSLESGTLVVYEGQELSRDPNDDAVESLRTDSARTISTTPKQTSPSINKNLHLKTETSINDDFRAGLQRQVQESKKQILAQDKRAGQRVITEEHVVTSGDRPPQMKMMTSKDMGMSVSMDIDPNKFKSQQADEARRRRAKEIAEEQNAQQQIYEEERRSQLQEASLDETTSEDLNDPPLDADLQEQEQVLNDALPEDDFTQEFDDDEIINDSE